MTLYQPYSDSSGSKCLVGVSFSFEREALFSNCLLEERCLRLEWFARGRRDVREEVIFRHKLFGEVGVVWSTKGARRGKNEGRGKLGWFVLQETSGCGV